MKTIEEAWEEVGFTNGAAVGSEWVFSATSQGGSYLKLTLHTSQGDTAVVGLGRYAAASGGYVDISMPVNAQEHLSIGIYPWSYGDIFTKALGAQDIELGDEVFDKAFVVKSNHPDWARRWVTPEARSTLAAMGDSSLIIEANRATCRCKISLSDDLPTKVKHAIAAVRAIGAQGTALLGAWDTLSQELSGVLSNKEGHLSVGAKILFEHRGVPLSIELLQEKRGFFSWPELYTQIACERGASIGDFALRRSFVPVPAGQREVSLSGKLQRFHGSAASEQLLELLSPREEVLDAIDPVSLIGDSARVVMTLQGIVSATERCKKAAELIAALCPTDMSAPYR